MNFFIFILFPIKFSSVDIKSLLSFGESTKVVPAQLILYACWALWCLRRWVQSRHNFCCHLFFPSCCSTWGTSSIFAAQIYGRVWDRRFFPSTIKCLLGLTWLKVLCLIPFLRSFLSLEIEGFWHSLFWWQRIVLQNTFSYQWCLIFNSFSLRTINSIIYFQSAALYFRTRNSLSRWCQIILKHILYFLVLIVYLILNFSFKLFCDTLLEIFIKSILWWDTQLHRLLSIFGTLCWWFGYPSQFPHGGSTS